MLRAALNAAQSRVSTRRGNHDLLARLAEHLGELLRTRGETGEAIVLGRLALKAARTAWRREGGDRRLLITSRVGIGRALCDRGEYARARKAFGDALSDLAAVIHREPLDHYDEGSLHLDIARTWQAEGKLPRARAGLSSARASFLAGIRLAEARPDPDRDLLARLRHDLSLAGDGADSRPPEPLTAEESRAAIRDKEAAVKEETGDVFAVGRAEVELAGNLWAQGDRPGAIGAIQRGAVAIETGLATGRGELGDLGRVLARWVGWAVELGDDAGALPALERAAKVMQKVRRKSRTDHYLIGVVFRDLARLHGRAGRSIEEQRWLLKAVEAMEPAVTAHEKDPFELGETCDALAWTYHREFKPWDEATRWSKKAVQYKEEALARGTGDPLSLGDAYQGLGWICHHTRHPARSAVWFMKAVKVKENALAEGRGDRNSLAYACRGMAWASHGGRDRRRAHEWLTRACREFRAARASGAPDWPGLALVAREFAEWHHAAGEDAESLRWYGRAIEHHRSGIRTGKDGWRSLAKIHFDRGRLHLSRNDDGYALADFHHAMESERKWMAAGNAKGEFLAEIKGEVARSYASEKNWRKSLRWYDKAARVIEEALAAGGGDRDRLAAICREAAGVSRTAGFVSEEALWEKRASGS